MHLICQSWQSWSSPSINQSSYPSQPNDVDPCMLLRFSYLQMGLLLTWQFPFVMPALRVGCLHGPLDPGKALRAAGWLSERHILLTQLPVDKSGTTTPKHPPNTGLIHCRIAEHGHKYVIPSVILQICLAKQPAGESIEIEDITALVKGFGPVSFVRLFLGRILSQHEAAPARV